MSDPRGLVVSPNFLGNMPGDPYAWDTSVFVQTSSVDQAAAALQSAIDRLMRVDFAGREYATFDEIDQALATGADVYTPNYISDVERRPDGASIVLDTMGEMSPEMAQTMTSILLSELRAAGVADAILRPTD